MGKYKQLCKKDYKECATCPDQFVRGNRMCYDDKTGVKLPSLDQRERYTKDKVTHVINTTESPTLDVMREQNKPEEKVPYQILLGNISSKISERIEDLDYSAIEEIVDEVFMEYAIGK